MKELLSNSNTAVPCGGNGSADYVSAETDIAEQFKTISLTEIYNSMNVNYAANVAR